MYHAVTARATPAKSIKGAQVALLTQSQRTIIPSTSVARVHASWPNALERGLRGGSLVVLAQSRKSNDPSTESLGGLFLFTKYRWNLANHAPTLSVLGRCGIQLWVESTSFLLKKSCTVFLWVFLEKEGKQDFEELRYKRRQDHRL